ASRLVVAHRLDLAQRHEDFGGRDLGDRPAADMRGGKTYQPALLFQGNSGPAFALDLSEKLVGDRLERVGERGRTLRLFDPRLNGRVDARCEETLRVFSFRTRIGEADGRVGAEGQKLLLASETIGEPPELRSL